MSDRLRFCHVGVLLAAIFLAIGCPAGATEPPKVVASFVPIHSLVAGVMEGIGRPEVLVRGNASPHTYQLKPSDARALERADLIIWVGESLEVFLGKPIRTLGSHAHVLELDDVPGIDPLPARRGGAWEPDENDTEREAAEAGHAHGPIDPHLWLDPARAARMVDAITGSLSELDPSHAAAYRANAERLKARLASLDAELKTKLAPLAHIPYIVFHDAYQYFEARYGLAAVGSVTVAPGREPGAKRLMEIRRKIRTLGARCVFNEPQFEPALVRTLIEGTKACTGILDPEGAGLTPGPEAYFQLLGKLGDSLATHLAPAD